VRDVIPLVIGGIPFGLIFGALATTAGVSPWTAMAMSLIVFAGSAQFIAINLMAAGAAVPLIVFTTFIVNIRHMLYAATLAPHVRSLGQRWLLPLGFMLTDEAFVVAVDRYNRPDGSPYKHWHFLGNALFMYVAWALSTAVGLLAGSILPDTTGWGLDFAMVVTFVGMLVPTIRTRPIAVSVLASGITALLAYSLPHQLGLIAAALVGVAAGVLAERALQPARTAEPVSRVSETGEDAS
jgi:4-azaleucine resistance transporter AzlC